MTRGPWEGFVEHGVFHVITHGLGCVINLKLAFISPLHDIILAGAVGMVVGGINFRQPRKFTMEEYHLLHGFMVWYASHWSNITNQI